MKGARRVGAVFLLCASLPGAVGAATYVKVADEWGTIQAAGPRGLSGGNRNWNIEGQATGFASSGTLRFYMTDLVSQLDTAFPGGWQVDKVTLAVEHDDAAFSAAGAVSVFHFTNDDLPITNGLSPDADAPPGNFATLSPSPLQYFDTATVNGQPVRVRLSDTTEPDMGTVTRVNDYAFAAQGDDNLDVLGTADNLVDPTGATNAAPDYSFSFPTVNPDDSLTTFATELATDSGDWSAGGLGTIIADIETGSDAISFIFASTEEGSGVAATYKGSPFGTLYPPRLYIEASAATPAGVLGDYNNNGIVDAADYVLWRSGGQLQNDPTPGVQNPGDYDYWRSRFGATRIREADWALARGSLFQSPRAPCCCSSA